MARTAHNGGEDSPGGIVSCKACLAQARAIVTHKGGSLFFTHDGCGCVSWGLEHLGVGREQLTTCQVTGGDSLRGSGVLL